MTAPVPRLLWIGTYQAPAAPAGSGEGIWRVGIGADGRFGEATLAATSPAPSFLAVHPTGRTLYAVGEDVPGSVRAFPVSDDGALGAPAVLASGGGLPCHLLALPDVLWIANYGDGVAASVPLDPASGAFAAAHVERFEGGGRGPDAERQDGPHAHFVAPSGDDVLVVDLGADVVRRYPARPGPGAAAVTAAVLLPGTGPRHLVVLPGGALVVAGELDARLHVLAPDAAPTAWRPVSAVPATDAAPGAGGGRAGGRAVPSHVALTGDLLTVGVRGTDVLAVHRVAPGDVPSLVAEVALGAGAMPRHHAVLGLAQDGRLLVVVARQGAGDLAAVLLDPRTGEGAVVDSLPLPTPPACVLEAS
ncbi:hypothetical protein ET495_10850 [Xylanimonas allomyrinae]|uniref:Lactonase family protein n=1 Tax=Xylanimonas allomyrinae TaxID=2509459 RepID=A0A4P6EPE7_9MICO|nr:beta-propeller fold lactonase family protein [Xylanimonas allomyrinae]QAY63663.1 hypothetical protein ET495_10850 [Xylanimonas allomyrinae]